MNQARRPSQLNWHRAHGTSAVRRCRLGLIPKYPPATRRERQSMFMNQLLSATRRFPLFSRLCIFAFVLVMPMFCRAQTITIFLADPQLGVVGAISNSNYRMYFDAKTPAGSTMSVRLLDDNGETIAISGHSMDSEWAGSTIYTANIAANALTMASALQSQI